ncbi:hypothetical protein EES45_10840 [Streptomyces sp. ADI97-07]|uniref:hypothetical protein n=1 Tax=Streptomyces sp. ADI97-07 TaxID=1522762 RepID=UPI000FA7288D|nr:hypothetical protein [Streptomyces sp. ADI97-07]RPK81417.1 hypothetical protein EES45_10840 [Streptomyces sp. ADI97-07]
MYRSVEETYEFGPDAMAALEAASAVVRRQPAGRFLMTSTAHTDSGASTPRTDTALDQP